MFMNKVIHEAMQKYLDTRHFSGAGILVRQKGEIVHKEYIGLADIKKGIPVHENTIYRLASNTKPIAGAAALMLEEQGVLKIDDPVSKYLPEFADMKVAKSWIPFTAKPTQEQLECFSKMEYEPLSRPITIEDLLRHRSGLGHGFVSASFGVLRGKPGFTLGDQVKAIASGPVDFQPGTDNGYSGHAAFDLLGAIMEKATGKPLDRLLQEMLFDPLEMKDTAFSLNDEQKTRLIRLYKRENEELVDFAPDGSFYAPYDFSFPAASAGLYSTLESYDHFVEMLLRGGIYKGKRFLKPETIRRMGSVCPADPAKNLAPNPWGLSVRVFEPLSVSGRYLAEGTFGWSGAHSTRFYVDPVNNVSMVLMVNRGDVDGGGSYISAGMEEAVFEGLKLKEKL